MRERAKQNSKSSFAFPRELALLCALAGASAVFSPAARAETVPLDSQLVFPTRSAQHAALARLAPSIRKTSALLRQIIDDEEAIKIYIERNGVDRSARELGEFAGSLAESPAQAGARARRVLHNMLDVIRETTRPADHRLRWESLFRDLDAARTLQASLYHYVSPVDTLLWLEELHRFVELELLQKPDDARVFLAEKRRSLDALWLSVRLARHSLRAPDANILVLASSAAPGPSAALDRLLRARIAAFAPADSETRREAIDAYCSELSSLGLARELDISTETPIAWSREFHAVPGCLTIRQSTPMSGAIVRLVTEDDVQMSYDSVVRAEGVNISVTARSFDGSLFDLSSPKPESPTDRNAGGCLTIDVRLEESSLLPGFVSLGTDLSGRADMEASPIETQTRVNGLLSFLVNGELRTL